MNPIFNFCRTLAYLIDSAIITEDRARDIILFLSDEKIDTLCPEGIDLVLDALRKKIRLDDLWND